MGLETLTPQTHVCCVGFVIRSQQPEPLDHPGPSVGKALILVPNDI